MNQSLNTVMYEHLSDLEELVSDANDLLGRDNLGDDPVVLDVLSEIKRIAARLHSAVSGARKKP